MRKQLLLTIGLLAGLYLAGCSSDNKDGCRPSLGNTFCDTGNGGLESGLACSAVPASTSVKPNEAVSVSISASGGVGPYSTSGIGSFSSFTSISKTYSTLGSVSESVTVTDSAGASATCQFSLTVSNSSNQIVACDLKTSAGSDVLDVVKNTLVDFTANASGGKAPYAMTLTPGQSGISSVVKSSNSGSETLSTVYTTAGLKTASLKVVSNDGYECLDSAQVRVHDSVLGLVAKPSTSVNIGSSIVIEPKGIGLSNPVYSYSTSEPNIQITKSGDNAIVVATDSKYHKFFVNVSANHDSGIENQSIELEFRYANALGCSVALSPKPSATGQDTSLMVSINNTGSGSASITSVSTPDINTGMTATSTSNPLVKIVKFTYAGTFKVKVTVADNDPKAGTATCETYHQTYVGQPYCEASFHNPSDTYAQYPLTEAKPNQSLRMLVKSNLSSGGINIDPGAPVISSPPPASSVPFPVWANNIVYSQAGMANASVRVTNNSNGQYGTCQRSLLLKDGLACTLNAPSRLTVNRTVYRGGTVLDSGSAVTGDFSAVLTGMSPPAYLSFNDGDGHSQSKSSLVSSVNFSANYIGHGKYTAKTDVTDYYTSSAKSCSADVKVDQVHNMYLNRVGYPGSYLYGRKCQVRVFNNGSVTQSVVVQGGASMASETITLSPGSYSSSQIFDPGYYATSCFMGVKFTSETSPQPHSISIEACLRVNDTNKECHWFYNL